MNRKAQLFDLDNVKEDTDEIPRKLKAILDAKKKHEERHAKKDGEMKSKDNTGKETKDKSKKDNAQTVSQSNLAHEYKKLRKLSDKRKSKLDEKKAKKKLKKQKEREENDLEYTRRDVPQFGEVVQAPPSALKKPKKLEKIINKNAKGAVPKGGLIAQQLLEKERQEVMQAYRLMKQRRELKD